MASPSSQSLEEEDLQSIYAARSRSITQPKLRNTSQGRRPPRTSGLGRLVDDESRLKRAFSVSFWHPPCKFQNRLPGDFSARYAAYSEPLLLGSD